MRVLETRAAEKFCPFARVAWARLNESGGLYTTGAVAGFNVAHVERDEEQITIGRCQGPHCMAWRTVATETREVRPRLIGLTRLATETLVERIGVCGLAGSASEPELPNPEASS